MQVPMWKPVQNVILNYERGELSNKNILIETSTGSIGLLFFLQPFAVLSYYPVLTFLRQLLPDKPPQTYNSNTPFAKAGPVNPHTHNDAFIAANSLGIISCTSRNCSSEEGIGLCCAGLRNTIRC